MSEEKVSRRGIVKMSLGIAAGVVAGAAGTRAVEAFQSRYPLPFYSGYAASLHSDRRSEPHSRRLSVTWGVDTTKKLVALTFDDGPMPKWTPDVLAILAEQRVRATFFMVGQRVLDHRDLLAGRLADHEVGNHTWDHHDLGRLDYHGTRDAIDRGTRAIAEVTGREPVLLRPPYGHLGGSSLLAASDLGYSVVLWNRQMLESDYRNDPAGLSRYIVESCTPGTIVLAHDTGPDERLVAIRGLPDTIKGLRARGFEFVTVSELLKEQ